MPSIFSYVVVTDTGFAPNPYHGYCTLATCKPVIRRVANIGDIIVGTGSAAANTQRGGFLVYAMKVTDVLSTEDYWFDRRFEAKKPLLNSKYSEKRCGDNCYEPLEAGRWRQLPCFHSNKNGSPNAAQTEYDTRVARVLVSTEFIYFGGQGPQLPSEFQTSGSSSVVRAGRGHRKIEDADTITHFLDWIKSLGCSGVQGQPTDMPRSAVKPICSTSKETRPYTC